MDRNLYTPTGAQTSEAQSLEYTFEMLLSGCFFIELAKVVAVRGEAPDLVVDVLPLLTRTDRSGAMIPNSTLYDLPVWRLQRGDSAVIMNPVAGDIGLIAVCDRDTSLVRANLKASIPGSRRRHSKSDAIYLGGVLNAQPTQFIEFADGAINITTPNPVNINCSSANINAPDGMNINTPLLKVSGDIIDNAGQQSSTLKALRDNYDSHAHPVRGVQSGNSTINSEPTDKPT
ncbi:phage baseplate protein [Cronobacter sp. EKM101R]|uniref:phage baseplate protein n=1 Tax=Cronobacter TaxID=413496 RepID=UPI0013EA5EC8|nr:MULTISPECIES: phage baseplate protein [Cronobacter]KAF6596767.1 phage baseplate protein [Cronobacter sp. EKM101R]KAF6599593.1 phage baseplate protein [Cronobacter sp. EKM102R]MDK1185160.1 phage baseplate protein [Cronobacter turicensis]MDK1195291.1 phage baseplate protein [Cronobacter dublinensis]MDK1200434.1 phage baseplate protein [Cronobacter dublinensis]